MYAKNDIKNLLVCDVDNTLIGNDRSLKLLSSELMKIRSQIILVYNSGRSLRSVRQSIEEKTSLPSPDYIIGNVGTQIEHFASRTIDHKREESMRNDWDRTKIERVLSTLEGFTLQPKKFQSEFKLSFYVKHDEFMVERVKSILHRESLHAEIVYSSRRDLDILPPGCNKGSAVRYLQTKLGIKNDQVIVAGDSKNDLSMFQLNFKGIVVGNASEELKNMVELQNTYISKSSYADGVLEGLKKWKVTTNN